MLELADVTIRRGDFGLTGISLLVEPGQYVGLMGKSGCGKTSLLETMCGLHPLVGGDILVGGHSVIRKPPALRDIGLVPQDAALFPTMSVFENLAFGLRCRNFEPESMEARVTEVAELLGVHSLLSRRPTTLSGGEARRVAIGRAIAFNPAVLLLDEPLSGLDDTTKVSVEAAISAAARFSSAAVLHVTHDLREIDRLAERVLTISGGALTEGTLSSSLPRSSSEQVSEPSLQG